MAKLIVLSIGLTGLGLVFYFFWWLGKRHLDKGKKYLQKLADTFDLTLDLENAPKSSFFKMNWQAFENVVGVSTIRGTYSTSSSRRGNTHFYHTSLNMFCINPDERELRIYPKNHYKAKFCKSCQPIGHPELDALYVFETNDVAFFRHHLTQAEPLDWLLNAPLTKNYWTMGAIKSIVGPTSGLMVSTHDDFILNDQVLASYETAIRLWVYFATLFKATYEAQKAAKTE